jgi:xanthine dehydrogenase accessory factor
VKEIFSRIAELREAGTPFALATVAHAEESTPRSFGARMIVHPGGGIEGTVGGGAVEDLVIRDALRLIGEERNDRIVYDLGTGGEGVTTGMICGGRVEVLIEVFGALSTVFIFGAGHVGRKIAEMCGVCGLSYWIVDDREEFAKKELFPDAAGVVRAEFGKSFAGLPIGERSYVVIVTYGHKHDGVCLENALKTKATYIGMIGSRKKVATLLESLKERGVDTSDPRIYAPVGLQLGDNTPGEIALSILAEIVKVKSEGSGAHMRDTLKT